MELSANKSLNKENNNPVLVPTQYDMMQKEGIFAKTSSSIHSQHRFYYRKQKQPIVQPIQNLIIGHSNSSQSMHKDIEKIAKQLQSQHIQTMTQFNFPQPLKERYPTQYSHSSNTQIAEVLEMFEKENLMKIQQIKPCTPRRLLTPQVNTKLPTLHIENKSNDQENQNEKTSHLLKNKLLFRRTINPSVDKIKKLNQPATEVRHKRIASQILNNTENLSLHKPLKDRINKVLKNSHQILQICNKIPEIQEQISEEQLLDLINSDHFKIEFQHLVNNSQGSNQPMEFILQNFMIDQIRRMRELKEAENNLEQKRQNFSRLLTSYIQELKEKL
ncbi:unnamed protein product (macronuclear) [Paramecium tetraurelia]|uniref:Uncharacterized protein n=1 Tax=Paramecium tetraurelia TaxID=5888 RepID=A0BNL5_PARTE|nr:uncharacterized protein GSPATT00030770001 [Paramecium tetraurelia]CAK60132.1 unnamed protein product [Paramecium tetraurelia]|eukprot:XP_001427530.1 hypothetical protein (macronuclear) [Paramecium tetraurelia strain d4-2]